MNYDTFLHNSYKVNANYATYTYETLMTQNMDNAVDVLKMTGSFDITSVIDVNHVSGTALDHFIQNLDAAVNVAPKMKSLMHSIKDIDYVISRWSSASWTADLLDARHAHVTDMISAVLRSRRPHPDLVKTLFKYVCPLKTTPLLIDVYLTHHIGRDVDRRVLLEFHNAGFHMNAMYTPNPWIQKHAINQPVLLRFYTDMYPLTANYMRLLWIYNLKEFKHANFDRMQLYWLSDQAYLKALRHNADDMIYSDPFNCLLDAAYHGMANVVSELIDAYTFDLDLPLHMAVRGTQSYSVINMLLAKGANPNCCGTKLAKTISLV